MSGVTAQALKAERFDTARAAFGRLNAAQAELQRLSRYRRMTPAMRDDRAKWEEREAAARADLTTALRFDPELEAPAEGDG